MITKLSPISLNQATRSELSMSITYYNLAQDGEKFLSPHFQVKEFADPSDYERVPFPETIPIHGR